MRSHVPPTRLLAALASFLLFVTLALASPARAQNLLPNAPPALAPWTAAFVQAEADVSAAFASGVTPLDILTNVTTLLNNHGYSAQALRELRPEFFPYVGAYSDVPFTILWRWVDPKSLDQEAWTCWYMDPATSPYCVDGDHVSMFGALGYDLTAGWRRFVNMMVAIELSGFMSSPVAFSWEAGEESGGCEVVSCRRLRERAVSTGNVLLGRTPAAKAVWGAFLTGVGAGATGSAVLFGGVLAVTGGGAALATTLGVVGVVAILGVSIASAAVGTAIVAGIIAQRTYAASGEVMGKEIGGANHRCADCGEAGTQFYGWDVSHDGQNCGSPACDFRPASHSHDPVCELGPREFSVVGGGGGTGASAGGNHWTGGDDDNDCGLWIVFEGEACAACEDLFGDDDQCGGEAGCTFGCEVCSDAGSSEHGTVDACVGIPNELDVEPEGE